MSAAAVVEWATRAAVVLVVTLATMPVAISLLRRRVLDRPNARSSHAVPTPRGGGIVPAVAAVAVVLAAGPGPSWWVASAAAVLAGVGFVDDLRDLPVSARLAAQVAVAVAVAVGLTLALDAPAGLALLSVPWIVGYVNAFNFMDGIDGISGLHATLVGLTWGVAGVVADDVLGLALGAVLAAAALGFLPYNLPRARVFLGDVGSYFLGGWIAVGAVVLTPRIGLLPALLPTAVYVADTAWTLLGRLRRGERWGEAHRDHVYQRLVRQGWSHARTCLLVAVVTAVLGALGLVAGEAVAAQASAVGLGGLLVVAYLCLPRMVGRDLHASARR